MFSTQRDRALTVTIRIILSALFVPPRMTLLFLESVPNALQGIDCKMVSAFFATRITPVRLAQWTSASNAMKVPGSRIRNASLAWTAWSIVAGALPQMSVRLVTPILPRKMPMDNALYVSLGGQKQLIRLSRIASVMISSMS
jgi:hypothetical protein